MFFSYRTPTNKNIGNTKMNIKIFLTASVIVESIEQCNGAREPSPAENPEHVLVAETTGVD